MAADFEFFKCLYLFSQCFDSDQSEAALFVDASNAFNNLNRFTTSANCHSICPSLAPILTNTYRVLSALFRNNTRRSSCNGHVWDWHMAVGYLPQNS